MKIKWLLIIFVLYFAIMLGSVLFNKQNTAENINSQNPVTQELAAPVQQQAPSINIPQIPQAIPQSISKSITVIGKQVPEEKEKPYLPILPTKAAPIQETSADSFFDAEETTQPRAGITKDEGKHPSVKEKQDMNSAGIVMY